eukprot:1042791-Lingulodinium_polyedra.AAC.1
MVIHIQKTNCKYSHLEPRACLVQSGHFLTQIDCIVSVYLGGFELRPCPCILGMYVGAVQAWARAGAVQARVRAQS